MGAKTVGKDKVSMRKLHGGISNILLLNSLLALLTAPAVFLTLLLLLDIDTQLGMLTIITVSLIASLTMILANAFLLSKVIVRPFQVIEQAVGHLLPEDYKTPAPDLSKLSLGREPVTKILEAVNSLFEQANRIAEVRSSSTDQFVLRGALLEKFQFPIIGLNSRAEIVYLNHNALSLIGRNETDIIGKQIDLVLPLRHENKSIILPWLAQCTKEKIKADKIWQDIHYTNIQHREYSYDVYAHFNRDDPSGVEAVMMLIDRTSEREFENMKVDFVALAAHELRAPITVIRGYMEVFEEEVGPQLSEDYRAFLTKMKVSGAQLAGFINNILDASRIDKGRLNLHFERAAWNAILKDAIDNLSLQAEALGRKINLAIDADLPTVMVDKVSIVEVINNLVDNAIKYSPAGSTVLVKCHTPENGGVQIDITDHGIGIPANLMGKLFTKFYRSHRSRSSFSGTGLGLYLSKAIIDAHLGNIWADSKEGAGSTFSFWLPPADTVAKQLISSDNVLEGVTRGSHGWIKNHSLYRR